MNLKLFTIKEIANGRIMTSLTPKVTRKWQVYFVNHFKKLLDLKEPANETED